MDTQTIIAPATVPAIPAEQLETIETRAPRLSVPASERRPVRLAPPRSSTGAMPTPRAWTMGGRVD